ncbi:DUF4251 domain-containing protein [Tenacibaculum tangerinum]|uniref:DUF4251 domain-containing protein n=1 Tax=Tenacibaculum tangerinum TaxID=3038772 RepID=A0ABY8L8Y3_9FLAO|nr:DUF4251 domain-containing protein [Tenacibaculum tangerinum]WGH76460.1 DUF4251 domain-containing protein [Tenacibaculum tangerinum]
MKRYVILISVVFILFGCAASKKVTQAEINYLDTLIKSKSFTIDSEWAEPQVTNAIMQIANAGMLPVGSNAGSINLVGNSNFFKMKKDTVAAYLPYFGERHMGGSYGGRNTGIEFEGIPEELTISEGKENSYRIRFRISDKNTPTEAYTVLVQVFPSLSSTIYINSSQKNSIRYRGKVIKTSEEK